MQPESFELELLLADDCAERQVAAPMVWAIRGLMLLEAAAFAVAALIHSGVLLYGYRQQEASVAEGVIFAVLLVALALTWIRPAWTRWVGAAAQAFALLGTLIGIFTIAIGA